MTDNHEHTPTTDLVRSVYVQYMTRHGDTSMKRIDDGFDRWLATVEAAAEQRGAIKALRHVASMIKLGNESYEMLVEDELNDRADQIINQTKTRNLKD